MPRPERVLIDQVTVTMDFDRGANHDEVIARTFPFVAARAPERPPTEHEKIARRVLDNLIDVSTTDRGFHTIYGALDTDVESAQIAAEIKLENLIRSLGNTSVVASRATVVVPHP